MKSQGLVRDKSLGHVISSAHRASTTTATDKGSGYTSTGPVVSTASGRTYVETQKGGNSEGAAARADGNSAASGAHSSSAAASVSHGATGNGSAHAGGSGVARGNSATN